LAVIDFFYASFGVKERGEMNSVAVGDRLDLLDSLPCYESAALRKGFKSLLQSQDHPFQETAVENMGKRMTIENAMNIGLKCHPGSDLPQASEEHFYPAATWGEILRVPGIAYDGVGGDTVQKQ
jgi:hypothetical protein